LHWNQFMDAVKHVGGVHHGRERQAARLHKVPAQYAK